MNTTLITHKLVHRSRKHTVPPPEGKVCTARFNGESIPRRTNRKGNYTQSRAELVTSPAIKDGKVCSRQSEPIRTSDPRGYNTGNVPPSYGPEDGNLFTTKKPSTISTNERSSNTATRKPGRGPQTGKNLTEKDECRQSKNTRLTRNSSKERWANCTTHTMRS